MDQASDVSLFVVPGVDAIGLQFYLGRIWNKMEQKKGQNRFGESV